MKVNIRTNQFHTMYRIGLTLKRVNSNAYSIHFNGTTKSITLPVVGYGDHLDHCLTLLKSLNIRVINYTNAHDEDMINTYNLVIPCNYYDRVNRLFNRR